MNALSIVSMMYVASYGTFIHLKIMTQRGCSAWQGSFHAIVVVTAVSIAGQNT